MISKLLHEVDHFGIDLWIEDGKLKYRATMGFPDHLKEALKQLKAEVIDRLKENDLAKKSAWSVAKFGDTYFKRLSFSSEIYIFREEDGMCSVWRGYWRQDEQGPFNEKDIVQNVIFHEALQRANNYVQWIQNRKSGKAV